MTEPIPTASRPVRLFVDSGNGTGVVSSAESSATVGQQLRGKTTFRLPHFAHCVTNHSVRRRVIHVWPQQRRRHTVSPDDVPFVSVLSWRNQRAAITDAPSSPPNWPELLPAPIAVAERKHLRMENLGDYL